MCSPRRRPVLFTSMKIRGLIWRRRPLAKLEAASRTIIFSRTFALASSFPSSAFFHHPVSPFSFYVFSVCRGNPHLSIQLRAERLGLLQWANPADFAEHGVVLLARHDLWRRRQIHLR